MSAALIILLFCACSIVVTFAAGSYAYLYLGPSSDREIKPSSEEILAALGDIPGLKAKTVKLTNPQGVLIQEMQILNKMSRNIAEDTEANTEESTAYVLELASAKEIDKIAVINKPGPADTIVGSRLVFLDANGTEVKTSTPISTPQDVLEYDILVDKWRTATYNKYYYNEDGTKKNLS